MRSLLSLFYKTASVSPSRSMSMTNGSKGMVGDNFESIREFLYQFAGGTVALQKDETTGVATISLDHPEKRNAMSGKMMVELRDCVEELEKWYTGKAVILCGKGQNFCSGGDLDFIRGSFAHKDSALKMSTWMQDALSRLQRLPLVSVCVIQGPSLGGGAEMSVFCDFIVASEDVKYGFVHGKMGIITAWGGTTRLVKKVGNQKALELLLTGRVLTAKDCIDLGLAQATVPPDQALLKTLEWLAPKLQYHYSILRAMKEIVSNNNEYSYEEALELEKQKFAPFWGGELNRQALAKNIKHVNKQAKM